MFLWWASKELGSPVLEERLRAVKSLRGSRKRRAFQLLIRALSDYDHRVREAAADVFASSGWAFENPVQSSLYGIARHDRGLLLSIGKPGIKLLIDRLADIDASTRDFAADTLIEIGEDSVTLLCELATKNDSSSPSRAIAILETIAQSHSTNLTQDSLQRLARLERVYKTTRVPYTGYWAFEMNDSSPGPPPDCVDEVSEVDCSTVRNAAIRELERRAQQ